MPVTLAPGILNNIFDGIERPLEEIAKEIGADSLGYLSIEGVKNIAENAKCNFCTGCFTGEYPIRVPKEMPKDKFERKIDE